MGIRNGVLCAAWLACAIFSTAALAADAPASGKFVVLPSGELARVPVTTNAVCGGQRFFPGTDNVDKFCFELPEQRCGGCVYDSGCTIEDNLGRPVGRTNRRTIDMVARYCSHCPFGTEVCADDFNLTYDQHFEFQDVGDCSRCQP